MDDEIQDIFKSLERVNVPDFDGWQHIKMFRDRQYEPHAMFQNNGHYLQRGKLLEIGQLILKGYSNQKIKRELNVCHKRVAKLRKIMGVRYD